MVTRGTQISAVALLLFLALPAYAAGSPAPPYLRIQNSESVVPVDQAVGDLLVVDGTVEIRGVVRGHVYAVDSEVVVRSSAVVLKSITVTGGSLHVSDGAVLPSTIELFQGARFFGPRGEQVVPHTPARLAGGATTVTLSETKASTVSIALMKSVLPFERFAPSETVDVEALRAWAPGLGLQLKRFAEDPQQLKVGGIIKLTFVSDQVDGAFQRGYKGARGSALFSGVRLVDAARARALYDQVHAAGRPAKVRVSIETALGDGAHWFFEKRGRHVMVWQRGRWLFALETRLLADKATLFQEKQFSDQVLRSLALDLDARTKLREGAQR